MQTWFVSKKWPDNVQNGLETPLFIIKSRFLCIIYAFFGGQNIAIFSSVTRVCGFCAILRALVDARRFVDDAENFPFWQSPICFAVAHFMHMCALLHQAAPIDLRSFRLRSEKTLPQTD